VTSAGYRPRMAFWNCCPGSATRAIFSVTVAATKVQRFQFQDQKFFFSISSRGAGLACGEARFLTEATTGPLSG
jgi:hypothetical protein